MGKVQDIVDAILFLENAVLSMGEIPRVDRWLAGHCQNGAMAWAAALPVNNQ
jgi:hypothetical protein